MDVDMDSLTPPAKQAHGPSAATEGIEEYRGDKALAQAQASAKPRQAERVSESASLQKGDGSEHDREADAHNSLGRMAINYIIGGAREESGSQTSRRNSILDRPDILLSYAQVIFNASILLVFLYLLFGLVWTVQHDVTEKVREYEIEYLGEIASCSTAYAANHCGTSQQAPALTEACGSWQRCAARDPKIVGRARVTAETFAEILNGFVDVVSWKTMVRVGFLPR